jgi:hypothetical protein
MPLTTNQANMLTCGAPHAKTRTEMTFEHAIALAFLAVVLGGAYGFWSLR